MSLTNYKIDKPLSNTGVANSGGGQGVLVAAQGASTVIGRSLVAGANITITTNPQDTEIIITASGGGGGDTIFTATTVNNIPTPINIVDMTPPGAKSLNFLDVSVTAADVAGTDTASFSLKTMIKNVAGAAAEPFPQDDKLSIREMNVDAEIGVSGQNATVVLTGLPATTINWRINVKENRLDY